LEVIDSHKSDDIITALKEQQELAGLLHLSPSLAIAYGLKSELIGIYESDITPLGGIRQIKKWLISAQVLLGSAADSVDAHLTEIANYFCQRTTSGVPEGINTRIKLILRQSYGFRSFDAMKEKLLACLFK
jgi:transposase